MLIRHVILHRRSAKGVVVREIDALGGIMGKITDQTTIRDAMLNKGKGPAVRALRSKLIKKVSVGNEKVLEKNLICVRNG